MLYITSIITYQIQSILIIFEEFLGIISDRKSMDLITKLDYLINFSC